MKITFFNASILKTGTVGAALAMLSSCGPDGTARAPASTDEPAALETVAQVEGTSEEDEDTPLRTTQALARPAAPENFTAAAHTDGARLSWRGSARAITYSVWRAPVPKRFTRVDQMRFVHIGDTRNRFFNDTKSPPNKDFIYRVRAKNNSGLSAPSNTSCSWRPPGGDFPGVRPKVYLSIHGGSNLGKLSAANQEKWSYVRMCLDGFYGNLAGVSEREAFDLIRRTSTRNYVGIVNLNNFISSARMKLTRKLKPVEQLATIDKKFPELRLKRGPIVGYSLFPQTWNFVTASRMRAEYINQKSKPARYLYDSVYMGTAVRNWEAPLKPLNLTSKPKPEDPVGGALSTTAARNMFNASDGHMIECIGSHCAGTGKRGKGFRFALQRTRDTNKNFLLFLSHNRANVRNWDVNTQRLYKVGKNKWRKNDIIMLINYQDNYPLIPEKDAQGKAANTLTGNLYWLLHR